MLKWSFFFLVSCKIYTRILVGGKVKLRVYENPGTSCVCCLAKLNFLLGAIRYLFGVEINITVSDCCSLSFELYTHRNGETLQSISTSILLLGNNVNVFFVYALECSLYHVEVIIIQRPFRKKEFLIVEKKKLRLRTNFFTDSNVLNMNSNGRTMKNISHSKEYFTK